MPNEAVLGNQSGDTALSTRTKPADTQGLYIVPPAALFSMSVLAAVATAASLQIGIRFHEPIPRWKA